ncbi:MAG: LSU ribosomal protein L32p @ LSU ribosomal protein L32p, zinc-dependent, partial [uncultured Solirubrobacterales bacterium]
WPSPSRSSRTRAPTSAARSTACARPRREPARSAASPGSLTACAGCAEPTPGARSSRPSRSRRRS